jgi:hypothetical protein
MIKALKCILYANKRFLLILSYVKFYYGVILHCFDWKYTDIKAELKNIAEAGFTSIQTSPVQGNNNHGSWSAYSA